MFLSDSNEVDVDGLELWAGLSVVLLLMVVAFIGFWSGDLASYDFSVVLLLMLAISYVFAAAAGDGGVVSGRYFPVLFS